MYYTERVVKININEISIDSQIPSQTNVPRLRSAERCDSVSASQFMAGKADLSISVTSASTAWSIYHPRIRSATTSGDVLLKKKPTNK